MSPGKSNHVNEEGKAETAFPSPRGEDPLRLRGLDRNLRGIDRIDLRFLRIDGNAALALETANVVVASQCREASAGAGSRREAP